MELWQYSGEPTDEEILNRYEFWQSWSKGGVKDNHLRIAHICPNCLSSNNTEWVRNEWCICYDCMIAFNPFDKYYDVLAYNEDDRIPEEILEEL